LIRAYQAIIDGLDSGRSGQTIQVINVNERTLTLGVGSAAMASRMRFEAPDLLARLHRALDAYPGAPRPGSIRIRVAPADASKTPGRHGPRHVEREPSRSGSQALDLLASAHEGEELSRALQRLSRAINPDD
ncbi:MAG: DciA family protein, partial [Guyparkeria sp.]